MRSTAQKKMARLGDEVTRLQRPQGYLVGLEQQLHEIKAELMRKAGVPLPSRSRAES